MTRIAKIDALLADVMGLDSASIGASSVERAVRARMKRVGAATLRDYWQQLMASPDELQELIELVVVPETWFFRDREALVALARIATDERHATPAAPLRLLSVPCSTGEEPYSMAMALRDAGLPAQAFAIDAVDISARALAHAQHAIYGKNSFRGKDLAFRDRHFEQIDDGYRLHDQVRESVRFVQGNVHADDFLPGAEQYDMIFCRNLLIYFDAATQRRTIAVLERLMRPSGVLFVGPAETSLFLSHGFVSANIPLAFALQRSAEPAATAPRHAPSAAAPVRTAAKAAPVRVSREAPRKSVNGGAPSAAATPIAEAAAIDRAFELADQGRLAEAKALCETELRDRGPSAQAYYLLGVIHSADGSLAAADRCYRKALYLDSHHHDALLHLAALLDQQGKAAEAKILRQRARRS